MSHKTKEVWRGFIPDLDQLSSDIGVFGSYTFSQQIATPLKFKSSPRGRKGGRKLTFLVEMLTFQGRC